MSDNQNYNLDIVFCVDGTGSMTSRIESIIESIKGIVHRLPLDLAFESLESSIKKYVPPLKRPLNRNRKENVEVFHCEMFEYVRAKIIVFRDYRFDGENAMCISPFFKLPEETDEFERCLDGISAEGGGDSNAENGLEALYYAMKSDFNVGPKDRQCIVLFTDADAYEPRICADAPNYPQEMMSEYELVNIWNGAVHNEAFRLRKRHCLVMLAPTNTKYKQLSSIMDRTHFIPIDFAKEGFMTITEALTGGPYD